jgi:WD40 repeat protein
MLWDYKQIELFSFSEKSLTRKDSFLLRDIIISACSNSDGDVFVVTSERILKYQYSNGAFTPCVFAYIGAPTFFSNIGAYFRSSISLNCDSSLLIHYNKSISIYDCESKKILFIDSFPASNGLNSEPKFSKFDPEILFYFDEFSIKVFRISKYHQGKDLYQCLIQSIPIKKSNPVLGLFSSSNGKYLFVQDNEGISRFKITKENNRDVLKIIKLKDIQFQFY